MEQNDNDIILKNVKIYCKIITKINATINLFLYLLYIKGYNYNFIWKWQFIAHLFNKFFSGLQ